MKSDQQIIDEATRKTLSFPELQRHVFDEERREGLGKASFLEP